MASSAPSPRLTKSSALAQVQTLTARVQALVPTLTTDLSPVTVYQPECSAVTFGTGLSGAGNVLLGGTGDNGGALSDPLMGVWVAPDANGDGSAYQVQVECLGAGGGGGGGSATTGGGGGGGAEYACEPAYTVLPGKSYVWVVSDLSSGGVAVGGDLAPGLSGGLTIFDLLGEGLPGGVTAHGGPGADLTAAGTGGMGGTGSANTTVHAGGSGGTVASGIGSDDPVALSQAPALWSNGGGFSAINAWYVMDDKILAGSGNTVLSDFSGSALDATIEYLAGTFGFHTTRLPAPQQVPTSASQAGDLVTNATLQGNNAIIPTNAGSGSTACAQLPPIGFSGLSACTISAWVRPYSGVWSNTAPGSWGTIAANTAASAYTGGGNLKGLALGLIQRGPAASPSWTAQFKVGNNSRSLIECAQGVLNPGTWNHVVATFGSGSMKLYVNGSLAASGTASITVIPASGFNIALCASPDSAHGGGYLGYMSNAWFASDTLTATGVAEAFGTSPAQGGAGGGASGGSGGAGHTGGLPSGAIGGTGGTAPAPGASIAALTTAGNDGGDGADSGTSGPSGSALTGGGGGGCGASSVVAGGVATYNFASAATYNGTDANGGTAAGALYNPGQEGTSSILFTGAGPGDYATGAKNSMLILDPGIWTLIGLIPDPGFGIFAPTNWVPQVTLTVFNASPASPAPAILELSYSYDTALPGSYTGNTIVHGIGQLVIPAGAASATIDLTLTDFGLSLLGLDYPDKAGALILGPGSAPTFEAYGAPTAGAFACQVYGPGAIAADGSSLAPFLTVTYALQDSKPNSGSNGAPGGLLVSYVNAEGIPVAGLQAFPVTDEAGTQWAQGFTGLIVPFDPVAAASGTYKPETWHNATPPAGWTGTLRYRLLSSGETEIDCDIANAGATAGAITLMTLTSPYYTPSATRRWPTALLPAATATAVFSASTNVVQATVNSGTTNLHFTQALPLS